MTLVRGRSPLKTPAYENTSDQDRFGGGVRCLSGIADLDGVVAGGAGDAGAVEVGGLALLHGGGVGFLDPENAADVEGAEFARGDFAAGHADTGTDGDDGAVNC